MSKNNCYIFALFLALVAPVRAQDLGRVTPASLPVPLPSTAPVPPTVLRSANPWYMSITGTWKFALTHGHIATGGKYISEDSGNGIVEASTTQSGHDPVAAFDGDSTTRWCAGDSSYPQWISVDLGKPELVTGVNITWETNGSYQFQVQGGANRSKWTTIADESAVPGIPSGPVTVTPGTFRFIRLSISQGPSSSWASISEVQIHYSNNGVDTIWQAPPTATPSANLAEAQIDSFASLQTDDSTWDNTPVPSNWEMLGYSVPTYGWVDNTVGQYRRTVNIPAIWAGKKIYWRFDGALDGAELFVNGQKAGYHEGGYNAFDSDITDLIKPGQPNLFAVRVSKNVPSSDCETGDFQCMGGIFRETALIAVPKTHVSDITVQTPLTDNYKDALLNSSITVQTVPGKEIDIAGRLYTAKGVPTSVTVSGSSIADTTGLATVSLSTPVTAPALWSAEKPNLYYLILQLSSNMVQTERVEQRFGFRQVEVKNNVVLWNGVPIKCTGVCRHDYWADKGFALSEANWQKDITLMKEANINAIRTSHYNHAERFLEICEERGMYILDEIPFCWIGDSVKDPNYLPYLIQRAQDTLGRDKNRPCVLAWSIGNENEYGINEQYVFDYVKKTDPTKPAFVSCMSPDQIKGQDWEDGHYPGPGNVDSDASHASSRVYNYSEHPHIFWQPETHNYDPGASDLWSEALSRIWQKNWAAPNILGSFIWEWQNQGIADKNPYTAPQDGFGPHSLRQENNKGVVDEYRNPKPEWWIVKQVYAKVAITARTIAPVDGAATVSLSNRYSFTNLNELACKWTAYNGAAVLKSGIQHIDCAPLQSATATFPAPQGITKLRLEFDDADSYPVVAYNLAVDGVPLSPPPPALASGTALSSQDSASTVTVSNNLETVVFNKADGTVQSWTVNGKTIITGGPIINFGEAKQSSEKNAYEAAQPPATANATITAGAPDSTGALTVIVASTVLSDPTGKQLGTFAGTYVIHPDAQIDVTWGVDWTAAHISLWDEGLKFILPNTISTESWLRDSFFTDYPAGHIGEPTGTAQPDDAPYRASKRNLHWLTLTDSTNTGVVLLPSTTPLIGRAENFGNGTTLFASRETAGPWDFSGGWVADHDIRAQTGQSLGGSFTLRAITP